LGGERAGRALAGASLAGWYAPDITPDRTRGIGGWSEKEIVAYLKTGWNSHAVASGPMAEVVEKSTARMRAADLAAIAAYLKAGSASPATAPVPIAAADPQMRAGVKVYRANCSACHGADGAGEALLFPPLARNPTVRQQSAESLVLVVLAGAQAAATKTAPTQPAMPSFAWRLNDRQVADLLTYVRNNWGNAAGRVTPQAVAAIRARLRAPSAD
jgi:mono/diheme cytochrome c family protein